ncbi:PREDICTED: uncharacterized protein LOC105313352 [Amphimedon queenslandica]|uniref:Translation initiation factor 3 N-terminal domain-containing protein n=1 Tax=Amphimedon queenslandica TaxID=400682 RepID=A0A1X7UHA3_AMPQE|nr:PREDICTED: uncharacterized protein LOC105313352 [Amphimedon queenslandica]|eukprot:XP_011405004.1 PREDICTED: uncharacterized protein LOC105313352 [Amphimedon queenslandica]
MLKFLLQRKIALPSTALRLCAINTRKYSQNVLRTGCIMSRRDQQLEHGRGLYVIFSSSRCYSRPSSRRIQYAERKSEKRKADKKKQVILIDQDGNNIGSMTLDVATQLTEAQGMELVTVKKGKGQEVTVCRMMSKKDIYDKNKKLKEQNKKDPKSVTKDIKFTIGISPHDIENKVSQIQNILERRNNVKIWIQTKLRSRQWEIDEMREAEQKRQMDLLDSILASIKDTGVPMGDRKWSKKDLLLTVRSTVKI